MRTVTDDPDGGSSSSRLMSDGWVGGVSLWGGENVFVVVVVVRGGRYQWRGIVVGVGKVRCRGRGGLGEG